MITYPVNVVDDRFTFKLGLDVKRTQRWPRADGQTLANPAPGLVILQESFAALPAFNPLTQKLSDGAWIDDEPNQTATFTRAVLEMSAQELAQVAEDADRAAKRTRLSNAIATLRQWADDADATTATSGNAVTVLNTVLDRLAVFFRNFASLLEVQRMDKPL